MLLGVLCHAHEPLIRGQSIEGRFGTAARLDLKSTCTRIYCVMSCRASGLAHLQSKTGYLFILLSRKRQLCVNLFCCLRKLRLHSPANVRPQCPGCLHCQMQFSNQRSYTSHTHTHTHTHTQQDSKNVFESGRQFGHLEERLVAKLSLVSRSVIPEVNKSLISLLGPFPRLLI